MSFYSQIKVIEEQRWKTPELRWQNQIRNAVWEGKSHVEFYEPNCVEDLRKFVADCDTQGFVCKWRDRITVIISW
jgi:hypothetical protein